MSHGIDSGRFAMDAKPPHIERPPTVEALAPGYELIHREAVARIRKLKPEDLDRSVPFFTGQPLPIRDILWSMIISHGIHHRGQLTLMCRLAGGQATHLPYLATYLGHVHVNDTYWYLEAVPELLALATQRLLDGGKEMAQ